MQGNLPRQLLVRQSLLSLLLQQAALLGRRPAQAPRTEVELRCMPFSTGKTPASLMCRRLHLAGGCATSPTRRIQTRHS
jgi:hypothetical protein